MWRSPGANSRRWPALADVVSPDGVVTSTSPSTTTIRAAHAPRAPAAPRPREVAGGQFVHRHPRRGSADGAALLRLPSSPRPPCVCCTRPRARFKEARKNPAENRGARIRTGTSATQRPRATRLRHAPNRASLRPDPSTVQRVGVLRGLTRYTGGKSLGFAAVADVRPFNALRYDLDRVGSLGDVVSPPYDVIDVAKRAELLERSSHNVVEVDLPKPHDEPGQGLPRRRSPLRARRGDGCRLARRGRPGRRARAGALRADPGLHGARRLHPHPPRDPRPSRGRGLRRRQDPPPRAHPARPQEGPARPDPRDPPQPLADLLADHRGRLAAGRPAVERGAPGAR